MCQQRLDAQPDDVAARFLLGMVHDAAGRLDEARRCYETTVYLAPDHAEALLCLALLADRTGDAEASARYRRRLDRVRQRKDSADATA